MKIYREGNNIVVDGQNRLTLFDDGDIGNLYIGNLYIDNEVDKVLVRNFMMKYTSKRASVMYTMRYFGFHTWSINIVRLILKFLR